MASTEKYQNPTFDKLVELLKSYEAKRAPVSEEDLEDMISDFLVQGNYAVKRQSSQKKEKIRNDLIVSDGKSSVCLEIKLSASLSHCRQLDKYGRSCDSLVLLCWQSSFQLKKTFDYVCKTSKIPVALVELRKGGNLF